LLGPGTDKFRSSYYRSDFNAFFIYSTGDCKGESTGGWDVPAGTVLSITVYQKPQPKFSDLGLDESRFKKTQSTGDGMNYVDEDQGLFLEVYQGTVQGFHYFPTHADEKMRCPRYDIFYASRVPKEARSALLDRLNEFVSYSRSRQYEEQYKMYLPEFTRMMFTAKNAAQFAEFTRLSSGVGTPGEALIEFKPQSIFMWPDTAYGEVCEILGRAKTDDNGNVGESYRTTRLVLRKGHWYFVDFFRLIPL
jgi:hypothetical protein